MDPNQTLKDIREAVKTLAVLQNSDDRHDEDTLEALWTIANGVINLDGWLSGGGFPPAIWEVF